MHVAPRLELDRSTDLLDREARRDWMDLFGEWIATKNGMLDTLLAMVESGEIAHAHTRTELLAAIDDILEAGRTSGELRADVPAEDIAAALIGIFTVAGSPEHEAMAARLLNLLMDGLRPAGQRPPAPGFSRADARSAGRG